MKVDTGHSLLTTAIAQSQARSGEDSERPSENFADLMAAMLTAGRSELRDGAFPGLRLPDSDNGGDIRASAFSPRIGTHGQAFEHARLLVETALTFKDLGQISNGEVKHIPAGQLADIRGEYAEHSSVSWNNRDLLSATTEWPTDQNGTATPRPQSFGQLLAYWLTSFAPGSEPKPLQAPANAGRQFTLPSSAAKASALLPSEIAHAQPQALLETPAAHAPEQCSAAEVSARTTKQASPFGAQLLAFEGGLRLVLRLPRLTENERVRLDADVAHIFESFGHRRHEIVINEIGKGRA